MERILLVMAASRASEAETAIRSAADNAFAPRRISYGLSLLQAPDALETAALRRVGSCQFLTPAADPWLDMAELWQGEPFVLLGCPEMRFTRGWDLHLLRELRACQRGDTPPASVLTGYLPRPQDPIDAVCPVAAESFDSEGRLCFHRGTPLRYAQRSPRSAFLHPRFCFGPATFFQQVAHSDGPRFLAAFQQRWDLYTLRLPLISVQWDAPLPPCPVEGEERALRRFEKRFSLRLDTRQLSPMARLGMPDAEMTFPLRVPLAVRLQEAAHRLLCRSSSANPMCTTAYVTLPVPAPNLPEEYLLWFQYLRQVRAFPLTCFAEGDHVRKLTAQHPNVLEYKRRYALPLEVEIKPDEALNYLRLSRPFLLRQTRERYPRQSHYIWIDFGYQHYPLYEGAALHWDAVCQDTILMARVGNALDTSMVVVPAPMLDDVCRDMLEACEAALEQTGRLPREESVWAALAAREPERFTLIDLPAPRELLTLVLLSREEEFHAHA